MTPVTKIYIKGTLLGSLGPLGMLGIIYLMKHNISDSDHLIGLLMGFVLGTTCQYLATRNIMGKKDV